MHRHDFTFHSDHFTDRDEFTAAVAHTRNLYDQVDRAGDLFADGPNRQIEAAHQNHRFDTRQCIARAVGVDRRERPVVAGVHCLQHVERFGAAALTDDDAVGTHTQRVAEQIPDMDLAFPFDIGRPRFESNHVRLVQQ